MKDLTGYMTVNGKDAWTEYSAFLCEDRREDNFNFSELLKPLEMKAYTSVDFRERNGEELPEVLPSPCCKARDVTLYFAIYASSPPCGIDEGHVFRMGEPSGKGQDIRL